MSATRPAMVFSIGIIARSASPLSTAVNASSNVWQGNGPIVGNMSRQAISELAPYSPWKAILLVFGVIGIPSAEVAGKDAAGLFEIGGGVATPRGQVKKLSTHSQAR